MMKAHLIQDNRTHRIIHSIPRYLLVLATALVSVGSVISLEDIKIEIHKGNLMLTNEKGGVSIGKVSGRCEVSSSKGGPLVFHLIEGDLIGFTQKGNIDIGEVKGSARITTGGGDISIIKAHGSIYAETALGEIDIQSAKSVEAVNTQGGDIKILDLSGNANISVRGNILIVLNKEFNAPKSFDLKTREGDITIYIPEDFNANLEIITPASNSGKETVIESEFNLGVIREEYVDQNQYMKLRTKINRGGKLFKMSLYSRNIYLKKRKK